MISLKNLKRQLKLDKLPNHIAFIMDGNGRWAKKRGMPRVFGHQKGIEKIGEVVKWCQAMGIKEITLFAFSTENWQRSEEEVSFLMDQATKYYNENSHKIYDLPVNIRVVGEKEPLPPKMLLMIEDINRTYQQKKLAQPTLTQVNFAFNYGSQKEIWHSVEKIVKNINDKIIKMSDLHPQMITDNLYVTTPVDLMIRTSGENRISNFLLWQLAYAELHFTTSYWPAFSEKDLYSALNEFQNRNRRFGKEDSK